MPAPQKASFFVLDSEGSAVEVVVRPLIEDGVLECVAEGGLPTGLMRVSS
jgi:hypothetical protein